MKTIDRYIARSVAASSFLVLVVLLALFSLATLVGELQDVGKGNYGVFDVVQVTLLSLPGLTYQLMPLVALLGTTLGLGMLALNNELVVLRASGISLGRVVMSVMRVGLVLIVIAIVLGEWVAPRTEQLGQSLRATALHEPVMLKTDKGFWARDGKRFINIRQIFPDGRLGDIRIFELDDKYRLRETVRAATASYQGDEWLLEDIVRTVIGDGQVTTDRLPEASWQSLIDPALIDVVTVNPEKLSTWGLYKYIEYLHDNSLAAGRYELALWGKIMAPVATGVMVFLAVPFIFGSLRSVSITQRILVSAFIGIGFHIFNQTVNYVALVYDFYPVVSAVLPTLLFFLVALLLLRRAS